MTETRLLKIQRWLYGLNALIWVTIGVFTLLRGASGSAPADIMIVIGVMMFGNAAMLLYLSWRIVYQKTLDLVLAALVLGVNILLTFTDQMGFFDWATLVLDLLLAVLLVMTVIKRGETD
ncbi:MAG: hypothetical protein JXA25_04425 [Anaerolineales bacterium]|nr:hypothetical protein [Anaerolineales bacterium]